MLIAIAVLAFVVLVSVQAFRGWPALGLGSAGDPAVSVSRSQAVGAGVPSFHAAHAARAARGSGTPHLRGGGRPTPARSGAIDKHGGLGGGGSRVVAPGAPTSSGRSVSSSPAGAPTPTASAPPSSTGGGGEPADPSSGVSESSVGNPRPGLAATVGSVVSKVEETVGRAWPPPNPVRSPKGSSTGPPAPNATNWPTAANGSRRAGGLLGLHR